MNIDTRLAPFGVASLLLVGSAAGCYTYNIYQLDGGGGADSTSTSSASAGGASSVVSTASSSSDSSSSADTSSSSSSGPSCSVGFPPPLVTGNPCVQPTGETSFYVNDQSDLDNLCYLRRDAIHEPQPVYDVSAFGFRLKSDCSEWTPGGYGPFVFRQATPMNSQQFVIVVARFDFQDSVTKPFHGAGVMIRPDETPAFSSQYALVSLLFRDGEMKFGHYVWPGVGDPALTEVAVIPAGHTYGAVALCYDQMENTVKAYSTPEITPAVPLTWTQIGPAAGSTFNVSKPFQIGAAAHAFAGEENVDALVQGLTVNYRNATLSTCEQNLPNMF